MTHWARAAPQPNDASRFNSAVYSTCANGTPSPSVALTNKAQTKRKQANIFFLFFFFCVECLLSGKKNNNKKYNFENISIFGISYFIYLSIIDQDVNAGNA